MANHPMIPFLITFFSALFKVTIFNTYNIQHIFILLVMLMLHDLKENSRSPSTGKATHTTCQTDWPKQLPATCVGCWHLDIQIAGCNMMQLQCATQSKGIHRSHIPNHDATIMFANGQEKYLSANHQNNSYSDDLWTKLHFCHGIANDSVLSWRLSGSPYASYTFYLHVYICLHVSIAPEAWSTSVQPGAPHPIHQCVVFPFSRIFGCPMIYEKKINQCIMLFFNQKPMMPWSDSP